MLVNNSLFLSFFSVIANPVGVWQSLPKAVKEKKEITPSQPASELLLVMTEKGSAIRLLKSISRQLYCEAIYCRGNLAVGGKEKKNNEKIRPFREIITSRKRSS